MESKHFKKLLAASALTTFATGSLFLSNAKVASAQTAEEESASDVTNQAGGEETLNGDSIVLRALNIVKGKATEAIADLGLSAEAKAGYVERVNAADSIAAVEAILAEAEGEAEEVARVLAEAKEAAKAELKEAGLTSDFLINKIDGAQTVEAVNAYKDSLLESHADSAESRELYEAKQKAYETLKDAGIISDFFLDKVASARTVEGVEAYVNELVESHEDSAESRELYEAKQKAYETLKEAGITSDFFLDKVASARTVEGVEAYVNELVESHEDSAASRALYEAKQKAYETLKEAGITSDFFLDKVATGRTVEGIEAYVDALIQSHEDSKEVEELEDFTLVINIDGEHAQTSEYAQIPYSQFTEILAALTESYLGRGYTYERADFKENNEVVLSFSSPAEDSSYDDLTKPGDDITDVVVDEGPKPGETTPSYDDLTKPGKDIIDVVVDEDTKPGEKAQDPKQSGDNQGSKETRIVTKADDKADPKKAQDSAQLPKTGFVSGSALGIGAVLAVAGSAITFRRRK